jgi:Zn-dependent peptidase ImmA (M78 family)
MQFNSKKRMPFRHRAQKQSMPLTNPESNNFRIAVVQLILDKRVEDALEVLAQCYGVEIPRLKVGLPKGHMRTAYGTYNAQTQTICVLNSDIFGNPFVILHEFYHHLRTKGVDKMHRGTEKNADKFAIEFLKEYQLTLTKATLNQKSSS